MEIPEDARLQSNCDLSHGRPRSVPEHKQKPRNLRGFDHCFAEGVNSLSDRQPSGKADGIAKGCQARVSRAAGVRHRRQSAGEVLADEFPVD